ncbi:MAG: 3'(2'),5'-bisphosphate nucleotidase CysQ [Salibacteraceae bacterium]
MVFEDQIEGLLKTLFEAGKAILTFYNDEVEIISKSDGSPVTQADIASNQIITDYLNQFGLPVMSEESEQQSFSERQTWRSYWCVDPLDGTREFIKRNGEFVINVALMENNIPIHGIIYQPTTGCAWYTHGDNLFKTVVTVDGIQKPNKIKPDCFKKVVLVSHSYERNKTKEYIDQRKLESPNLSVLTMGSALKFCELAEGKADEYPRFATTMEWDSAAGHAIVNRVGKQVINWRTKQTLNYNKKHLRNEHFLVS